jgi:hypothetical protein
MGEIQSVATHQKLAKGPKSMTAKPFSGGTMQETGTSVPLSMRPVPLQYGMQVAKVQSTATSVGLGTTPHKGWESHPTPVSNRAADQSSNSKGKR